MWRGSPGSNPTLSANLAFGEIGWSVWFLGFDRLAPLVALGTNPTLSLLKTPLVPRIDPLTVGSVLRGRPVEAPCSGSVALTPPNPDRWARVAGLRRARPICR